nr:FAD binding domain-containing protein [Dongshaea marina]
MALDKLGSGPWQLLAGGTDLLVQGRMLAGSKQLLDISGLEELGQIDCQPDRLSIGGGVHFSKIVSDPFICSRFPLLARACATIGSRQIRNRATLAGNIVNAAPCADSAPPLIAYGAEVELCSVAGTRFIDLEAFITGSYRTQIRPDEILKSVHLPVPQVGYFSDYYAQLGRRNAVNITRQSLSALFHFVGTESRSVDWWMGHSFPSRSGYGEWSRSCAAHL